MVDTYGKTWWREGYACGCMIQSIEDIVEPRLKAARYHTPINIFQQAYNSGGVSASAGTHDGGGALDHDRSSEGETRIWRECGWADWRRGSPYDSMDDHNHGIVIGCPHVSSGAADQVNDYKNGRNGLAGGGADPGPDVPYITWEDAYEKYKKQEDKGGILGMTKAISMRRSADWKVPGQTDGWDKALPLNDDGASTFCSDTGDAIVVAVANVTISGLKEDEAFDIAWSIVDCRSSDGGDAKWPSGWVNRRDSRRAVAGESGYRTVEATFTGTLGKANSGRSKRLRLVYQTPSKTANIGSLTVEGGY